MQSLSEKQSAKSAKKINPERVFYDYVPDSYKTQDSVTKTQQNKQR